MNPTIAVVGATGLVGRQVLRALEQHDVEPDQLRLFSSERSEGEALDYQEEALPTDRPGRDAFRGVQVVLMAAPASVVRPLALEAQLAGAWVVDVSGAFRVDPKVPLVSPGVNDGLLDRPFQGRIVSVAGASTQAVLEVLQPLRSTFGLTFADVTLLLGSASLGAAGPEALSRQTAALMNGKEPETEQFPHRLGFNVVPGVGAFEGDLSDAERHLLVEVARVWAGEQLPALTATALLVPTYHGTTAVLSAHLSRPVDADGVRALFKEESGLKLLDEPAQNIYPMPMLTTDDAAIHVGRVRAHGPRVQLIAAVDNTHRLASSAVELALELAERD